MQTVVEYLRKWRADNNFSQEQVADQLGVSQTTYNNWENGRRAIPLKHYTNIAKVIEANLSELVPDGVTADVSDGQHTQEVLKLDVKDFLRVLEENNGLLKRRCDRLEEENIRLSEENKVLRAKLSSQ